MIYIALFGFFLAAGLVVLFMLTGEGKNYGRQGNKTNFPGGLML